MIENYIRIEYLYCMFKFLLFCVLVKRLFNSFWFFRIGLLFLIFKFLLDKIFFFLVFIKSSDVEIVRRKILILFRN